MNFKDNVDSLGVTLENFVGTVRKLIRTIAFEHSLWVSYRFLKKNLCSRKPPTRPLRRNWTTIILARALTTWNQNRRNQASKRPTSLSAIMPETYVIFIHLFIFSNYNHRSLYLSIHLSLRCPNFLENLSLKRFTIKDYQRAREKH